MRYIVNKPVFLALEILIVGLNPSCRNGPKLEILDLEYLVTELDVKLILYIYQQGLTLTN